MSGEVSWQVELAVRPDELDNFRALTREMVRAARKEPGVLIYERFIGAHGDVVYVYERYADSAAAIAHLQAFQDTYSERFSKIVDRKRFMVFGAPSNDLKDLLDRFGATYLAPLHGFSLEPKGVS